MTNLILRRLDLALVAIAACAMLAPSPALAQRVSLGDIDAKIDTIQATLDQGPVPIAACGTIDQPGSYVLVNNLTSSPAGDCLVVTADRVSIDLGGFAIDCGGSGRGVSDNFASRTAIAVRNGTVTGCARGVELFSTQGAVVKHVRAVGNTFFGIVVGGAGTVTGNTALSNGSIGIVASGGSTVTGNTARLNGDDGISASGSSTVTGNTALSNGDDGIVASTGSTVSGNTARSSGDDGIVVVCPSNLIGNTATGNIGTNLVVINPGCNLSNNLAP